MENTDRRRCSNRSKKGQTESNIEHEYSTDGGKTWNKVEDGKIVITEEG